MSAEKDKDRNSNDDKDGSKPTCNIHLKEVCLYCKKCDDILCLDCLVETHQRHPVAKISDVIDFIKHEVEQSCIEHCTLSDIKATKEKLCNAMEISNTAKTTYECNIRRTEKELKDKIEEKANLLSQNLKAAFEKHEEKLQQWIDKITDCECSVECFGLTSMSHASILQLYCRLKDCRRKEFKADIELLQHPNLCLNPDNNVSLGVIKPDPDDERTSQVAKICNKEALESIEEKKVYPIRVDISSIYQVSKIIPVKNDEAWIISKGVLYYLKQSKLSYTRFVCTDDIASFINGDLLLLRGNSAIINRMDLKWAEFLFTRTDPHLPVNIAYLQKNSSVMVLLNNRSVVLLGPNGIRQRTVQLPVVAMVSNGHCMEAMSGDEFCILGRSQPINQNAVQTDCIISYTGNPLQSSSFAGTFGVNPGSSFVCQGICYDNEGFLIVSDLNFKAVYKLDKKLKLQKILIDKHEGLKRPTVVALKDGLLWVTDGDLECISIYKYSDIA